MKVNVSTPILVRSTFLATILLVIVFQISTLFSTREILIVGIQNLDDHVPSLIKAYWSEARMYLPAGALLNYTLKERYQNPKILRGGCAVTVLLVDPDLDEDAHWALESVADNIHPLDRTCFLLQTSVCMLKKPNATQEQLYEAKVEQFMRKVKPKFLNLIERGNVRMTVLDTAKYDLRSCLNFYNPSFLFENYLYWGSDEFDPSDSDQVLMIQADAVLCHDLNTEKWKDVAWVGSPWIASKGEKPWNFCTSMPRHWEKFHSINGTASDSVAVPAFPSAEEMCSDTRHGPQGNGGLSLRSRSWIRKAIKYCPTDIFLHSGLSREAFDSTKCKATEIVAEDLYFLTILKGLGAPLPTNFEAALFAQEMRSAGDIALQFNLDKNHSWMEDMVVKRWYSPEDPSGLTFYRQMQAQQKNLSMPTDAIVSIGLHKPWNIGLKRRINEKYLNEQCPYMKKMLEHSKFGKQYVEAIEN